MQRIKVLAPIFFLLLAFLALRLLMPHSLNNDEAEQVLAASEYVLGYPKQPPLYSWIVRSVTLLFGMEYPNIYILSFLKYFFYGIFIYFLYLSAELVFGNSVKKNKNAYSLENQSKSGSKFNPAFLVVISNLLFVTYFYDFARDLTHSILATMFAAIGFYVYLRLWLKPSTSGYLLLGIVFGLGFLAKYNFIFFALSIVAASLLERRAFQILINPKTFLSIGACLLVFTPNLIYLIKDKLNAVNYALDRSGSNENQVFSLVDILKSSVGAFYETILVITILLILFVAFIHKKRLRSFIFSEDIFNNHRIRRLFFFAGVFSILIPLLIMLIMGADKFYAKWLSPSCFLVVFAFYSCIDFHKKAGENVEIEVSLHAPKAFLLRRNLLYVIVSSCFLVSASVLFIGGFFPDLIGKVTKTQYPYDKLSSILYREYEEELALTKDGKLKLILITNGDPVLKGNLVLALERTEFKKLLGSGDCQLKSLNEIKDSEGGENVGGRLEPKALSLYVWDARLYGRSIPKVFQTVIGNTEDDENAGAGVVQRSLKYKLVKVRYINSEKQYYELGILARKSF